MNEITAGSSLRESLREIPKFEFHVHLGFLGA